MGTDRLNVLLIEDNPGDMRLIREFLSGKDYFGVTYRLYHASCLEEAVEAYEKEHIDVILLDLNLPDSTGLPTIQRLNGLVPQTPIVVLTGGHDEQVALQSVKYGAQDYVNKNACSGQLLNRIIHYAIERKKAEERLKHLAMHDPLTGLPNRALFYDRLSQALQRAERSQTGDGAKMKVAIMLLDLDNFKTINDSLGHAQGDIVLQLAASRLKSCVRQSDTAARLGGDEFIFVIEEITSRADCISVAERMLKQLQKPALSGDEEIFLDASLGISIFPEDATDIENLIRCADQAMYTAKRQHTHVCFYQDQADDD